MTAMGTKANRRYMLLALTAALFFCRTVCAQSQSRDLEAPVRLLYQKFAAHYADGLYDINLGPEETETPERLAKRKELLLDLESIPVVDSEFRSIAKELLETEAGFEQAAADLDELPELPSSLHAALKGMQQGMTGRLDSTLGDSVALMERDQKGRALVTRLVKAADRFEAAKLLLPRIAKRFAGANRPTSILSANVMEAWGYDGADRLGIRNRSGSTLHNCTVRIELVGKTGETRQSIHFTPKWPDDRLFAALLYPGIRLGESPYGRTTVTNIRNATITLFCDEFTFGPATIQNDTRNKWIGAYLDAHFKPKSSYRPYAKGMLWDNQRTVAVGFDGLDYLPPGTLVVGLTKGFSSATQSTKFSKWTTNEVKRVEFRGIDWEASEWTVQFKFDDNGVTRFYKFSR